MLNEPFNFLNNSKNDLVKEKLSESDIYWNDYFNEESYNIDNEGSVIDRSIINDGNNNEEFMINE